MRVRRAGLADLPALLVLGAGSASPPTSEEWDAALRRGELVLLAEVDDAVVGYGRAGPRLPVDGEDPAPPGWWLAGVVVAPGHRRRGVARRLVVDRLAHRPADSPVWSMADAGNVASLRLHAATGFTEVLRAPRLLGQGFRSGEGVLLRHDG